MTHTRRTWFARLAGVFAGAAAVKALPVPTPPRLIYHPYRDEIQMTLTAPEDVDRYERVTGKRERIGTTVFIRKPARFEPVRD